MSTPLPAISEAGGAAASWFETSLPHHPVFGLPDGLDAAPLPRGRANILAVRGSDLLLAVNFPPVTPGAGGSAEIRIASLIQSKPPSTPQDAQKASYRPFAPRIPFTVRALVSNPCGKVLAVVGESQLQLVILPRPGWATYGPMGIDGQAGGKGPELPANALPVGSFYHTRGSPRIAKVLWHPWGQNGSSLLVLTDDGILREYDISADPSEPAQSLSVVNNSTQVGARIGGGTSRVGSILDRSASRARSVTPNTSAVFDRLGRLGLDDDEEATTAVSFTLSPALAQAQPTPDNASSAAGWTGWSPLEI